jgi:membrane-bound metal-dependent hydrolase YbcI (DUF457 family)
MYPLGHIPLAYFMVKIIQKYSKGKFNLYYVMLISVLPDIDFIIPIVKHRGITHSITALILFSVILLLFNGNNVVIYVVSYFSHIFADLITANGVQLYAPLSTRNIVLRSLYISSKYVTFVEITLFIIFIVTLIFNGDINKIRGDIREL